MDAILPWQELLKPILKKYPQPGKRLNCADRSFNRKSNRTRSRVEHAIGVIKHLWSYRKVRYRGLGKSAAPVFTLFGLANFCLVGRALAETCG